MPPTTSHIRDVANSCKNDTPSNTTPSLSVILPVASFALIFWALFSAWFWLVFMYPSLFALPGMLTIHARYLWQVGRSQADRKAHQNPVYRLLRLQNTVPAVKFLHWRQQQCSQTRSYVSFPSDYPWLVALPLATYH
jgi:hypothetical protein